MSLAIILRSLSLSSICGLRFFGLSLSISHSPPLFVCSQPLMEFQSLNSFLKAKEEEDLEAYRKRKIADVCLLDPGGCTVEGKRLPLRVPAGLQRPCEQSFLRHALSCVFFIVFIFPALSSLSGSSCAVA